MAESSYWWTTSDPAVGDGLVSYTQAHLATVARVLAACSGFEGVAPGYLNQLAPTANGANTVAVNTGGAVVDGKVYLNSASVNVNIPSASGGGNTRIDRITVRVVWAGATQTTRITRIAGTDAASPTAPALVQTTGTTYDISLATVLVNTAGTVVVTDARTWAGNLHVLRLGGGSTHWSTAGQIVYTPTLVRVQTGADNNQTVTFPVAFSATPIVILTQTSITTAQLLASTTSVSAVTVHGHRQGVEYNWLAIGPK